MNNIQWLLEILARALFCYFASFLMLRLLAGHWELDEAWEVSAFVVSALVFAYAGYRVEVWWRRA